MIRHSTPDENQKAEMLMQLGFLEEHLANLKQNIQDCETFSNIAWPAFHVSDKASAIQIAASKWHKEAKLELETSPEESKVT